MVETSVESAVRSISKDAGKRFGLDIPPDRVDLLGRFAAELVRWNQKFNLTAISSPAEVAELHVLDSLAVAPFIPAGSSVLDIGTGGGFPGVPLAISRPDIQVQLVDRTEKKILFLKSSLARLGIRNAKASHLRVEGEPGKEGVGPVDVAVSRAFAEPRAWLTLARAYVKPGGRILAMLGSQQPDDPELQSLREGDDVAISLHPYSLPSGAKRAILVVNR